MQRLKMMNSLCVMLLLLASGCSAQLRKAIDRTENATAPGMASDSVVQSIQKRFDLVIGYSTEATTSFRPKTYHLIGFQDNQTIAFTYVYRNVRTDKQPKFTLDSISVSSQYKDSVLSLYLKTKAWEIEHFENDNTVYCSDLSSHSGCNIHDGTTYNFIVMTKRRQRVSNFYEPDYYENCCPGNKDRQRFLATIGPIQRIFLK